MRTIISIIIPIFKGEKYIEKLINQISASTKKQWRTELIFVNDAPQMPIEKEYKYEDTSFVIKVLQTNRNFGIQGARIRGLRSSAGEFIHFLDQDDEISHNFYESQLNHIGDADAVYCRCYNGSRQTYNYDRVFETAFDREKILKVCPVVSPGQVLIRRRSIPSFWTEHVLKNIGSDDYFLWLCMYGNGCRFALNQEILYRHVRNGDNYSSDILRTKESDEEMVNLFLQYKLFPKEIASDLRLLPERQLRRRYEPQRKDQIVLQVLSELLSSYERGYSLERYFAKRGVQSVAIYGAAVMGERIKGFLSGTSITVSCFLDKNAPFIDEDIPVYKWNEDKNNFDAVVISLIEKEDAVMQMLMEREGLKIYTIRNIVRDLADG